MLSTLLKFEAYYYSRQFTFWLSVVVFFGLGLLVTAFGNFGGKEVMVNAPTVLAQRVGLITLCLLFVAVILGAHGTLRDQENRFEGLIYAFPMRKGTFFLSRFAGMFLAIVLVFLAAQTGFVIGYFLRPSAQLGAFHLFRELGVMLLMAVPNLLFCSGTLFLIAMLSRNVMAVYLGGVLLFVLFMAGSMLGNSPMMASYSPTSPEAAQWAVLFDPFGLAGVFLQSRLMSPAEMNTQMFPVEGAFLWNRIGCSLLGLLFLFTGYRLFSFKLSEGKRRSKKVTAEKESAFAKRAPQFTYRAVLPQVSGIRFQVAATFHLFKMQIRLLKKDWLFWCMMLLLCFFTAITLWETLNSGYFGIKSLPSNAIIITTLLSNPILYLLLIFYSGEFYARAKQADFDQMLGATPAFKKFNLLAVGLALCSLILMVLFLKTAVGIAFQIGHYPKIDFLNDGKALVYNFIPFAFWAVLFLMVQSLTPHKYIGMFVSGLLVAFAKRSANLGIEHPLAQLGFFPELTFSEMAAFGQYATAFWWFALYWFSGLLLIKSLGVFVRINRRTKPEASLNLKGLKISKVSLSLMPVSREQPRVGGMAPNYAMQMVAAILIFAISAFYIFYQTNYEHTYSTSSERDELRAKYEREYQRLAAQVQPIISAVETEIDVFPDEQRMVVKGKYQVENQSEQPIGQLWLGVLPSLVNQCEFEISGASLNKSENLKVVQHFIYQLQRPLKPHESKQINFTLFINRNGFARRNSEVSIVPNGTFVELEDLLPFFGYNEVIELKDQETRKEQGLAENSTYEPIASKEFQWVDYKTTISIPSGKQEVVTVGQKVDQWEKNGRKYARFESGKPIAFMFGFSIAEFEITKEVHKGVELEFYFHKGHRFNKPSLLQSARNTLDSLSAYFGEYPYAHCRFVEMADNPAAATAYPGMVFMKEDFWLKDYSKPNSIDYVYALPPHEMGHHWWGGVLEPAFQPGYRFLTETLAQYSEMLLMRDKLDFTSFEKFMKMELEAYFSNRAYASGQEEPLSASFRHSFVYYHKGLVVMNGIEQVVGKKHLLNTLRSFCDKHQFPNEKATFSDFENLLYQGLSEEKKALINSWLHKKVLYDFSVSLDKISILEGGQKEVTLAISARKWEELPDGTRKDLEMDELLPLAFFSENSQMLNQELIRLKTGEQLISVLVDGNVTRLLLDPWVSRIEKKRDDNALVLPSIEN